MRGRKPQPRAAEVLPEALTCSTADCSNRARYEITDDAWQTCRKVCSSCFLHWNGTLPVSATLASPRQ